MTALRAGSLAVAVGALLLAAPARARAQHPEVGPHKGVLAEWGDEEYHLMVVPDKAAGTVTVYVLDGQAKNPRPIDAKQLVLTLKTKPAVTVRLAAAPEPGDSEGKSSKFIGQNEVFTKEMKFEGTFSGKAGGKPYSGDFKQK
jgi:hypothetical protein